MDVCCVYVFSSGLRRGKVRPSVESMQVISTQLKECAAGEEGDFHIVMIFQVYHPFFLGMEKNSYHQSGNSCIVKKTCGFPTYISRGY